jgi:3-methyladenine DNA glycosylase Tag
MTPPPLDRILRNNENFNRIFNNFDFKKTVTQVEIPELV